MSILGQATRAAVTTRPAATDENPAALLWLLVPLALVALWGARRAGVFRRHSVNGPVRVGDDETLGTVLMMLGLAVFLLIVGQMAAMPFVGVKNAAATTQAAATAPAVTTAPTAPAPDPLTDDPGSMAVLLIVPAMVAMALVTLAHAGSRRDGLTRLGLSPAQLGRGVTTGVIAGLIMVPLVFLAAQLTQLVWHLIQYKHPPAHQLLETIRQAPQVGVKGALVAAAVVVAPLWEEFLFRGHLQTLIAYTPARIRRRLGIGQTSRDADPIAPQLDARGFDVIAPAGGEEAARSTLVESTIARTGQPGPASRWAAIVITSLLFAAMHVQPGPGALWMLPPIFFLSLCVGYAYERTGNLWVPIVMHAMFNATSTILFFLFMH